ncbi:MAG: DUF4290 domain-containing protein [Bacteroidales bacterium]|nr:DUF4290 domain-containing protein [Bacteroidales bacterium]
MEKDYNTERKGLRLPEYGRNVQKMVSGLMDIEDRQKRNEQARAVVKVMELLNPQVHLQEDYERKLWDHLFIISDFRLDVDSPYPKPTPEDLETRPAPVPVEKRPIKATHYGRNIESIIDLIAGLEDGETKTWVIRNLAIYMRTQYLIWNKDSVADETIFSDIEKLSGGRVKVPEGLELTKVASDANFSRPGTGLPKKQNQKKNRRNFKK